MNYIFYKILNNYNVYLYMTLYQTDLDLFSNFTCT